LDVRWNFETIPKKEFFCRLKTLPLFFLVKIGGRYGKYSSSMFENEQRRQAMHELPSEEAQTKLVCRFEKLRHQ